MSTYFSLADDGTLVLPSDCPFTAQSVVDIVFDSAAYTTDASSSDLRCLTATQSLRDALIEIYYDLDMRNVGIVVTDGQQSYSTCSIA